MKINKPLSEEELQRNMRGVRNAIAQQELEGLTVSPVPMKPSEALAAHRNCGSLSAATPLRIRACTVRRLSIW